MSRLLSAIVFGIAVLLPVAQQAHAQAKPEKADIVLGLPINTSTFLPIYLADEEGYFKAEGLNIRIVAFRGGTDLVRGMIAGGVDIGLSALAEVSVGIAAEQPIKVFYGGFNMAVFDWYAAKDIMSMKDTKGKRFGITTMGSSTDLLTRYALEKQGIDPKKDVRIVQGGGSAPRLAAMDAGQLDVNIFAPPEKFMAADQGYNLIFRQTDIAPDYPFHTFFATESFLKNNPDTIRAFLRGFIKGVRLAKADKNRSIKALVDRVGLEQKYAARAYDDFIDRIYEDGRLPSDAGMDAFWKMGIEAGQYKEPWPKSKYLDTTFIDSYQSFKPAN